VARGNVKRNLHRTTGRQSFVLFFLSPKCLKLLQNYVKFHSSLVTGMTS
jgi:hypothetical protein